MIAAIYARKSTKQDGVADEARSVARQIDLARAFATEKGWTVADEHIYVDDGISGAEFERRPGLQRMLRMLKPRAPFAALVVSELKSIGRESSQTNYIVKQLAQAGVEVFGYMGGKSLTPRNWIDKAMMAIQSAADEAHQRQTSERTHEAHLQKLRMGHVVGGRVFGYRNVDVMGGVDVHGRPVRTHVVRQIDPVEAAVVRRIFELFDSGLGLKAIAKRLTSEGAPSPIPSARRDGLSPVGWSPSTVRSILTRDLYRGVVVWNRSRKRDDWGQVHQRQRPASEHVTVPAEHLRLVPDELWKRVAARRADTAGRTVRFASGRLSGRPPKHAVQNLLAGLATCGVCGGGMVVETSGHKHGRVPQYVCHRHRRNGSCSNGLRMAVARLNEAVLQTIEEHALTPEAIEQVVRLTERDDLRDRQQTLQREAREVAKQIARVVDAIAAGGQAAALVAKLHDLEARQRGIASDLDALRPLPRLAPQVVESRLDEWRRLLRQSTTQGRAVLQKVLAGRVVFHPTGDTYRFEARTRFDKLFAGVVVGQRPAWVPDVATGLDHVGPADTFDADYGLLLERACGKGLASPVCASWNQLKHWLRAVHGLRLAA